MADVVVPTYNRAELLLDCLRSLTGQAGVERIVVVDDASSEDIGAAVAAAFPDVIVVRCAEHRGLAYAFNRGVELSTAEAVLFLNNDIVARPGAVSVLESALAADPAAVSAGGRLVDPGTDTTQLSYQPRELPGACALIVRLLGVERRWPANPVTGQHLRAPAAAGRTDRQPAGACLLVRRSALDAVGGWDEHFSLWYEDVDLSARLLVRGPALYVPDAVFEHVGTASTSTWSKPEQHIRLYPGTLVYAQAHLNVFGRTLVAVTMFVVSLMRFLMAVPLDRPSAARYRTIAWLALRVCVGRPVSAPLRPRDRG